jgi:hypothetical protein
MMAILYLSGKTKPYLPKSDSNKSIIVKNLFCFSSLLFTAFNVDEETYRQVLAPFNNSQLLSKLEILDKFRLVTNHKNATQRKLRYFLVYTGTRET